MPIYEYQCEACGGVFEKIQKFSDEPLTVHQDCGGHVHRLVSAPSLRFKGTGWYITDYAKGNGSSAKDGTKAEGAKSEGGKSEGGKSDTAAATTESKSKSSSDSAAPASTSSSNSSDKK
jgi:putative FmdB family regulatory protein